MAQLFPVVVSSNGLLKEWEERSIKCKEEEGSSRNRTQKVEKGRARV
jgi:hypothetical protein